MTFPTHRPRRLRRSKALRGLVRETQVSAHGLVYPMFACPGAKVRTEVSSMPGIFQQSPDQIVEECREVADLGIPAVILFGLPEHKDETGSEAASASGAVQLSIEAIRKAKLDLLVITDVCLCEYTSHGHCGVIKDGRILNDPSIALLADAALSHARAGADIVAPSDMMDGRVAAIRASSTKTTFTMWPFCPTPQNTVPRSTARSAKRRNRLRSSATVAAIRWIPPMLAKLCAKSSSISPKART